MEDNRLTNILLRSLDLVNTVYRNMHQTNNKYELEYLIHNVMSTTHCKGEEKIQTLFIVFSFLNRVFWEHDISINRY
jgi:hypothetical protein